MSSPNIIVLGTGMAGFGAAYRLHAEGIAPVMNRFNRREEKEDTEALKARGQGVGTTLTPLAALSSARTESRYLIPNEPEEIRQ